MSPFLSTFVPSVWFTVKKQIPVLNGLACKLEDRPVLLLVLAALALLIFFLLRRWLWILLVSYLAFLFLY